MCRSRESCRSGCKAVRQAPSSAHASTHSIPLYAHAHNHTHVHHPPTTTHLQAGQHCGDVCQRVGDGGGAGAAAVAAVVVAHHVHLEQPRQLPEEGYVPEPSKSRRVKETSPNPEVQCDLHV